jgi:hypothetical protein
MATRTANTGSNNWNTNAAWVGGVQPTVADDVVIPSGAVVTIPASTTVSCRSLSLTGTGTLTQTATGGTINCGDGTAGTGNVAISVAGTATWNTGTGNPIINLVSTSTTQQIITTGGVSLPNVQINSVNSSYILGDAFTISGTFTLNAGTFDTDSYNMTVGTFSNGGSGVRTLTLGSSAITVTGNMTNRSTNLTVTANTATITTTGASPSTAISGSGGGNALDWNGTSFVFNPTGSQSIIFVSGSTVNNLTITGGASKTAVANFNAGRTLIITGTLSMTGDSTANRLYATTTVSGLPTTLSVGTLGTFSNLDLMDITASGASAPWDLSAITGLSGDCLGNTNITFTTAVAQTMSSGGSWDNAANWTSRIPLPQDNVTVTGSGAVTLNMQRFGRDIDLSGYSGTMTLTSSGLDYELFGSVMLGAGMSWGLNPNTFRLNLAGRGAHTVTSNGIAFFPVGTNAGLDIAAPNGTYTLTDNLNYKTPAGSPLSVTAGTFDSANYQLDIGRLTSTGTIDSPRTINLGTSTINLHITGGNTMISMQSTGLTPTGMENATFNPQQVASSTKTFDLGGATIGTLNWNMSGNTGAVNFTTSGRIVTLNFSDASNARTLQITGGQTLTVDNFNVFGGASRLITVRSSNTSLAFLSNPRGQIFTSAQDYIAYEYIAPVQPQSLWLNTNSTATNCVGIGSTAPTYRHKQSTATTLTGTSITAAYPIATTPGSLLIVYFHSSSSQGTYTPPAGWTLAVTKAESAVVYIYFKVADGTEGNVTFSQTTSRVLNAALVEYTGFSGTPTLDVTDSNNNPSLATSLSTNGTNPSNTDQPALALALLGNPSVMAATTGLTNNFIEDRTLTNTNSSFKGAVKELTTIAAVNTTFSWTTSRANSAIVLAVFTNVPLSTNGNFFLFFN